jgi:glutamate 5-kinase
MSHLAAKVARLHGLGVESIIVSSGAIAAGRHKLGLKELTSYKWIIFGSGQVRN